MLVLLLLCQNHCFRRSPREPHKVYCDICDSSWDAKNKRRSHLIQVEKEKFKRVALKWELVDHRYNTVYKNVNWSRSEGTFCCKSCHSTFFKEAYMNTKRKLADTEAPTLQSVSPPPLTPPPQTTPHARSSSRKKCLYETRRDIKEERKCIIR